MPYPFLGGVPLAGGRWGRSPRRGGSSGGGGPSAPAISLSTSTVSFADNATAPRTLLTVTRTGGNGDGTLGITWVDPEPAISTNLAWDGANLTLAIAPDAGDITAPVSAQITYTGDSAGAADPADWTIEVTDHTAIVPLLSPTLYNTSADTSTLAWRPIGLAFEDGQVPAGSIVKARVADGADVAIEYGHEVYYASGCLRFARGWLLDDTPLAAGTSSSRQYEIYAATGSKQASALDTRTWLAANATLETVVSNNTVDDGSGAVALSGDRVFNLATAAATADRFEDRSTGKRLSAFRCRQKVVNDEHMVGLWFGDLLKSTDGSAVKALRIMPKIDLPFIIEAPFGSAQTRGRRGFDQVTTWGGSTIHSEAGVDLAVLARYPVLRQDVDDYNGDALWINVDGSTPMPTTRIEWADQDWVAFAAAGACPPVDRSLTVSAWGGPGVHVTASSTDAGGATHNGAATGWAASGGYAGRGLLPDPVSRAIIRGGAVDWRDARIFAIAVDSVQAHVRDHRTVGSVESYGLIPFPFEQQSIARGDAPWTGLGQAVVAVEQGGSDTGWQVTFPGGNGAFTGFDSAHVRDFAGFMAWFEARDDLADATLSIHDRQCRWLHWNSIGHDRRIWFAGLRTLDPAVTTPRYGMTPGWTSQERSWGPLLFGRARMLTPDTDRHAAYLDTMAANVADWVADSMAQLPVSQMLKGGLWPKGAPMFFGNWMTDFTAMSFYFMARIFDQFPVIMSAAHQGARLAINTCKYAPAATDQYRQISNESNSMDADYLPPDLVMIMYDCVISGDRLVFSRVSEGEVVKSVEDGLSLAAGDRILFASIAQDGTSTAIPAGLDGVILYVIDPDNSYGGPDGGVYPSCKLSLTEGGSAITIADQADASVGASLAAFTTPASLSTIGRTINADSYARIKDAVMHMAWLNEHPDLSQEDFEAWLAFFDIATTGYAAWAYDATQSRALA